MELPGTDDVNSPSCFDEGDIGGFRGRQTLFLIFSVTAFASGILVMNPGF